MHLTDRLIEFAARPLPLRTLVLRNLLRRFPVGSYEARLRVGGVYRPNYAWCMYYAAVEAKALGHKAVTIIELGVAGGNGLMCLCRHRKDIQKALGIEIVVVGFDSGAGLPQSTDPRDMLYAWPAGAYRMDRSALESRIGGQAQLVLGDVAQTVHAWNPEPAAPLGAVMFDLDYFTSTLASFALLAKQNLLPRVWCYFDDVCAGPEEALTERIGEREAIRQFNDDPERKVLKDHLSPAFTFKHFTPEPWHQRIYLYHRLNHPDYNVCLTVERQREDHLRLGNS
jgi:hypothetical protein